MRLSVAKRYSHREPTPVEYETIYVAFTQRNAVAFSYSGNNVEFRAISASLSGTDVAQLQNDAHQIRTRAILDLRAPRCQCVSERVTQSLLGSRSCVRA